MFVIGLLAFKAYAIEEHVINVAQKQTIQNAREEYLSELLIRALESAQYPSIVNMVAVSQKEQRELIELDSTKLDVYWSMSSPQREASAIAIKIPLFKGYIGKRALLTNKQNLKRFEKIKTAKQLSKMTAVQGFDWPDTKIMSSNGLAVRPSNSDLAMFTLVSRGRVDYFPRSFIEVNSELIASKQGNLVVVPNLYISYPTGIYYFVTNKKPKLASVIKQGLETMQKNGEFDALFNEYFAKDLNALPYTKGKTTEIKLINPFI